VVVSLSDQPIDPVDYFDIPINDGEPLPAESVQVPKDDEVLDIVNWDPETLKGVRSQVLIALAQEDSPQGFAAFFELLTDKKLTTFAMEWVTTMYYGRSINKYIAIEAFRGSAKTTVFCTFVAFRIGHNPTASNLIIQVGDDIAADNSGRVADIIANHPAWKLVFPNIIPDVRKGWGNQGYEVMDRSIDYGEWRRLNSERKDPSLLGLGYKSRAIIGKRPTGILLVDDILDENNTSSDREMTRVDKILRDEIFPTLRIDSWVVFVFTPWKENDPVVTITDGEDWIHIKTPLLIPVSQKNPGAFNIPQDDPTRWYLSAWPELFPVPTIMTRRRLSGKTGFARMYMLDLSMVGGQMIIYQTYPANMIDPRWIMVGGVDYASISPSSKVSVHLRDYFCLVYVAKNPQGGAVIVGGVIDRPTSLVATSYVMRAQAIFPAWSHCAVETDGKSEEWFARMQLTPHLRLVPVPTRGVRKGFRIYDLLSPWLENGVVKVSDADTPFLNELRKEMQAYPDCEHDDALDAVYTALKTMPDVLKMEEALGNALEDELPMYNRAKKKKLSSPWSSLSRIRR
jgi:hypothetical protein